MAESYAVRLPVSSMPAIRPGVRVVFEVPENALLIVDGETVTVRVELLGLFAKNEDHEEINQN